MENDETISEEQKTILSDIMRLVRQGESFSEALASQNGAFPELLINMFRSAEETGSLDRTAMRMAEHYQKEYRLQTKIRSAMMYPKILAVVIAAVVMIIFSFIMPQLTSVFQDMELPVLTQVMLAISAFVRNYWMALLVGIAILFCCGNWLHGLLLSVCFWINGN